MTEDPTTLLLAALAATLLFATWHARRLGNERRDVTMLGAVTALLGVGAGVSAFAFA